MKYKHLRKLYMLLAIIVFSFSSTNMYATKYFVAKTGDNSDGSSWTKAFNELHYALTQVVDGDTIIVAKGTYKPTGDFDKYIAFEMVPGVKIFGGFNGTEEITTETISSRNFETNETILSGDLSGNDGSAIRSDNSYTVIIFDSQTAAISNTTILDGFTISGGNSVLFSGEDAYGGGIYMQQWVNQDCSPLLRNLIITNNRAKSGAGMYLDGLSGSNAVISPTLENVVFENNYANQGSGGGIYMSAAPNANVYPTLTEVAFINNTASNTGGGIFFSGGLTDNSGTVSSTISNATFYGNACNNNNGAAVYIHGQDGLANPVFNNVIFYGNDIPQIYRSANTGSTNPSFNHCLIPGSPSSSWNSTIGTDLGGNIDVDPLLADPENGNIDIITGSPVLGAGDNTFGVNIGYYQKTGIPAPIINITADLQDFGIVEVGNTSDEQTFTITGSNLLGAVIINLPEGFEASQSSGAGFFNPLRVNIINGLPIANTIYVRFNPDATGSHTGNITINSPSATEHIIAVSAYAGSRPEVSPIADQSTCSEGSLSIPFTVSDDDLSTLSFDIWTSDETILPKENTEVSGANGSYILGINTENSGVINIKLYAIDSDQNKDSAEFILNVIQGPTLIVDFTQRACNNDPAEISLSATGGTGSISYNINNQGYSTNTYYDYLTDGDYVIVAKDENECTDTSETYTISNPDILTATAETIKEVTCRNNSDASLEITASGGWGNYQYSIDNGITYNNSNIFENLSPGNYTIYIRDEGGCEKNAYSAHVYNPDELIINYITTTDADNGNNGTLNIVAFGGWAPLSYSINESNYQSESYFTGLAGGQYIARVKDNNGCTATSTSYINSTGIGSILDINVEVYPNPASEYISVDLQKLPTDLNKIELYSLNGQIQDIKTDLNNDTGVVYVNNIKTGAYFIILHLNNSKVIIKKINIVH